jgi:signal transduction histidine kinase
MHWQLSHRNQLVYATLAVLCLAVIAWQSIEHRSVRQANHDAIVLRGRDITTTLGLVLRSQRRFGPFTAKERLEPALKELIRPGELDSIVILSPTGEPIVSAGKPMEVPQELVEGPGLLWGKDSLTLMNLVDLGTVEDSTNPPPTTIVLSEDMVPNPFGTNRNAFRNRSNWREREGGEGPPPTDGADRPPPPADELRPPGSIPATGESTGDVEADDDNDRRRNWRRGRFRPPPFGRPPWISEEEYQELIQKRGVHSFVIGLSTSGMAAANSRDFWMRLVIALLTTAAAGLSALAWRNVARSAELQIRLVRAGEMNAHLKELNLAAAGLAHETRNPLNLIRGLAQLISQEANNRPDIADRSKTIMDEADRVTAQLNEFINYSRPREVRRVSVPFKRMANEIARTLAPDAEDKNVTLQITDSDLRVEADDPLLRQVLFNLMLNAVQAVDEGGTVEVDLARQNDSREVVIEVRDDGPGVPPEQRSQIFKPYVTMNQHGTGLGLSVVQQIVSTHGWEIECLANEPRGALFRISHVKLSEAGTDKK